MNSKSKLNSEHLIYMTNVFMNFDKAGPTQTLVIDQTRFIY